MSNIPFVLRQDEKNIGRFIGPDGSVKEFRDVSFRLKLEYSSLATVDEVVTLDITQPLMDINLNHDAMASEYILKKLQAQPDSSKPRIKPGSTSIHKIL